MGFTVKFGNKEKSGSLPVEEPRVRDQGVNDKAVVWSGHFTDYSGYAKANREILFRVANVLRVNLLTTGLEEGLIQVDRHTRNRVEAHRNVRVHEKAPFLRFFGPDYAPKVGGYKIVWTMMETMLYVHHQIVAMINQSYDELWTPTEWNRQVFVESGVKVPSRVMPLGVNSLIYRKVPGAKLPSCRLLTSARVGEMGVPDGFVFLSVGLPSFRKGFDVLAEAFTRAFGDRHDVHLVFGTTHSIPEWNSEVYRQFGSHKAMIWTLEGQYSEHEMARIYSASNCYVSASRGEGFNLPMVESAACGIPVIVPFNTSHPEISGDGAWLFDVDPPAPFPNAKKVSAWYEGMPFSTLGERSIKHLAEIMRAVVEGGTEVARRTDDFRQTVCERWTWDNAARLVTERLLEVQP